MPKSKKVITWNRGRLKLDVLALDEAMRKGILTEQDRQTADKLLPGICERLERDQKARLAAIGRN